MKTAQIPETNATRFSILKGILQRNNSDDIDVALQKYPMDLTEGQLLEVLEIVGLSGNISALNKVKLRFVLNLMICEKCTCMQFIMLTNSD